MAALEAGGLGAVAAADRRADADGGAAVLVAQDRLPADRSMALAGGIAGADGERADGGEHAAADAGDRRRRGTGGGLCVLDDGLLVRDDYGVVDRAENGGLVSLKLITQVATRDYNPKVCDETLSLYLRQRLC